MLFVKLLLKCILLLDRRLYVFDALQNTVCRIEFDSNGAQSLGELCVFDTQL